MAQYDVDLREYWRILKKRKFSVLIIAIALGLFSTLFAVLKAPTPLYTSVCSIKIEKDTTAEGIYARTFAWSSGDDIATQISVLKSYSVMQKVAEKLGLLPKGPTTEISQLKSGVAAIVNGLQSKVEVSRESFTNIIDIAVTDSDPVFARLAARTIALTYREIHAKEQNRRTTDTIKYIAEQLKNVRQKLRQSEDEFNRFTQKNQLVSIDLQSENLLLRAKEARDELRKLAEAEAELGELLVKLEQFTANPSGSGNDLYSTYANKSYQDTNDTMVGLLLKRDSLLEDFTEKHPEVIAIQRKIIESARKMGIALQLQISSINRKKMDSKKELVRIDKTTSELMEKKLEFDRLKRKVDSYNDMTALLERKNQEALIRKAEKPEGISVVRPALLPIFPINPPRTMATGGMGIIIGLILGMVAAFIAETFDTSLGAIEDVEETLGTQVLGVIPHGDVKSIQEGATSSSFSQSIHLVSHFMPQTMLAESFRGLRTSIQLHDVEKKLKVLAVTSASPQEGKTMVSSNLVITMAQAGVKILFVDSDLRKPRLAQVFGIETSPGLTDVLLGNYSWRDVIRTVTDIIIGKMEPDEAMFTPGLDNLHIITSGNVSPNPGELIDSKRLVDFIEDAKKDYDLIIFDTPPILSAADSTILGTKVDGVLLVYHIGKVSRGLLKRSAIQLSQVNCNIMGAVLNGMKAEVSPDFQDFKHYKYYYSHEDESKWQKGGKGIFSYLKKMMPKQRPHLEMGKPDKTISEQAGTAVEKKPPFLKIMLALISVCVLIVGLMWQNGVLPIDKYLFKKQAVLEVSESATPEREPLQPVKTQASASDSPRPAPPSPPPDAVLNTDPDLSRATTIRYPYSLCIGSFRSLREVEDAVTIFKGKGLTPYWTRVDLGKKGIWFRVFAGSFTTPDEAGEFRERHGITADRILKTGYTVRIGEYSSKEGLDHMISTLKSTGCSPYFIGNSQEGYRLLIGAFVTQEAANELAHRVKETGTDCKVVSR